MFFYSMGYVKKHLHGRYQEALVVDFELFQLYKRTFFHFLLNKKKRTIQEIKNKKN